ncbi:MAG TPA: HAMP domain-containing sensor histidine kinase [Acidimicrobiales bacterium]
MTLRARIALALALLAGLAALLVGVVTFVAIGQRVRAEVDRSLSSQAAVLRDPDRVGVLIELCTESTGSNQPGRRPQPAFEGFGRLGGVVTQCLDPAGEPVGETSSVVLPVNDEDRALAAGDSDRSHTRTARVDGVTYRMETVPVNGAADIVGAVQFARDYTESQRVLDALRWLILGVVVVVTGLGALAGWLIARRATKPLVQLTDAAELVASTGSLDVPLPAAGNDEPGRLSRAFATMLAALGQSRAQQQQLVQDAGHELRTPLTSLRTNVETLQRHPDLPTPTRDAILTDLDAETRELGSLVDELVQLATDTYADEPEQTVALDELVERAASLVRRRSGRTVVVTAQPSTVIGRPRDLSRAVGNLIDNAAKFSEAPSPIEVSVTHGVVQVRDHGAGVAEDDQAHVFQRFYRAASARATPGSGLGLSIVEQTARTHNGTVSVTNHPGGGAVFTLALPEAPPPPPLSAPTTG